VWQTVLIVLVVALAAGWLAGRVWRGRGLVRAPACGCGCCAEAEACRAGKGAGELRDQGCAGAASQGADKEFCPTLKGAG